MGRKMIVVSDESDFVVAAKAFCESKGGKVKVFTNAEWSRGLTTPGFAHSLTGDVAPLALGQGSVDGAKILPFPMGGNSHGGGTTNSSVQTINQLESVAIQNAIMNFGGNLTEAAKALGIGRATLYRKVKQYNIDPSAARRKKAA